MQVRRIQHRLHAAAAARHRRAARLRHRRRRLLRRADRPGRALHAQRPVHRRAEGQLVDRPGNRVLGRNGAAGQGRRRRHASTRARNVVAAHQPAQAGRQPTSPARRAPRRPDGRPGPRRRARGLGRRPGRSMVDMIGSLRAFEAGQKVIQTIDETLGKAATQVGRRRRLKPPAIRPIHPSDARRTLLRRRRHGRPAAAARRGLQRPRQRDTTGYKHVRVGFRDLLYQQAGARPPTASASAPARRGRRRPRLRAGRAAEHRQPARRRASRARASCRSGCPTAARRSRATAACTSTPRPADDLHRRAGPAAVTIPRASPPTRSRSPPTARWRRRPQGRPDPARHRALAPGPALGRRQRLRRDRRLRRRHAPRRAARRSSRARSRPRTSTWPTRWST